MIITVFSIFIVTLLLGMPIGIAVAITAISAGILNPMLPANAAFVFRNMVTALDSYPILAVPLFILSGNLMAKGGISKKLFSFFAFFMGKITGGLPATVVITCLFYGAISGSGPATVAAVGSMTIPLLVDLGYDKKFVTALVATAGGLGVIIPPSIPFIVYGLSATESVGALFIAGILPGILIGSCLIFYTIFYCYRKGEDKEKLEANHKQLSAKGFLGIFSDSFFALLSPVIILGGIYGGIVTPTEAANISVVYALFISVVIYKSLSIKDIPALLKETIKTTGPVLIIVSAASVFGRVLTLMQAPQSITTIIMATFESKVAILLIINLFLLFVGMVMDTISAILILTPIFMPIIAAIGVNPIHFGVIMVVNLAIGFVTPPIGVNLYVASSLSDISVMSIARKAVPFAIAFIIALMFITFIPEISLFLVN